MTTSRMEIRHRPLATSYRDDPASAWVTDVAWTTWTLDDPLHTAVVLGPDDYGPHPVALHRAVGGESDGPVPGDLLCAALASCLDSTLRVVADRFRIGLRALSVHVAAEVDVRGALCLAPDVPVAFQHVTVQVDLRLAGGTPARLREQLLRTAERSCVVLQTLRRAVPVALVTEGPIPALEDRAALAPESGVSPVHG